MALTIVGCGPGSPGFLTPQARQAVAEAEVLVGSPRLLELFADPAERIPVGCDVGRILDEIAARLPRRIAVLVSGDPGLCSLARPVLRRFGRSACQVIPAVSSVQVAFARLGLDWQDARVLSTHHRDPDVDGESLRQVGTIAVLGGRAESLPWIARLHELLGSDRRVFVCQNLTLPSERVREVAPQELTQLRAPPRTIVLLVRSEVMA